MVRGTYRRRSFVLLVVFLMLGAALLIRSSQLVAAAQDGTPAASDGKILRIGYGNFPILEYSPLDPQLANWVDQIAISGLDYEGLTRLDEDSNTVPGAAESWEFSEDGLLLTFHLREGLTYADGSPLTAERFAYAAQRTCDPRTEAPYATILFDIVGCEELYGLVPAADEAAFDEAIANLGVRATDDRTLEIDLKQPAAYFPTVAFTWVFDPVKEEAVAANPDGWWRDPATRIGNGPFRMTALDAELPDQRIAFAANDNYWDGRPKLDGLEYIYFPVGDEEAGLNA
jgi:oligopeptide transport system substrate-binding protein